MTLHNHQHLQELLYQLRAIVRSIPFLDSQGYKPPIIDRDTYNDGYAKSNPQNRQTGSVHHDHNIAGMRIFKDAVCREIEVLEQFLSKSDRGSEISTNASYFVAVWTEILSASPPIVAIGKIFEHHASDGIGDGKNKNKKPARGTSNQSGRARGISAGGIKVDVVADEGRQWIRVNTMKNSRILAEFREIDSYLTGSEDESPGDDGDNHIAYHDDPSSPPTDQDNSLLHMGRTLAAAARSLLIPGTNEKPSVTLRLTRLQPDPSEADGETTDPRIAQTIDALKRMGLDVQLGERAFRSLCHDEDGGTTDTGTGNYPNFIPPEATSPSSVQQQQQQQQQLHPTKRINMDLSMLIALVSDLSHAVLPENEEGAWARFRMPVNTRAWKLGKTSTGSGTSESTASEPEDVEFSKHSRALSLQCIQEMERGLIDDIVRRLSVTREKIRSEAAYDRGRGKDESGDEYAFEFWTTEEARERCVQIVEKIGGEEEKRRVHALFALSPVTCRSVRCGSSVPPGRMSRMNAIECAREEFWRGSRYPALYFPSLIPIHIHPPLPSVRGSESGNPHPRPHPHRVSPSLSNSSPSLFWAHLIQTCRHILSYDAAPHPRVYRKDGEMERAKVTSVNTKLTVHTVESMLVGACAGMTTLTANRTSVRAVVREMKMRRFGGDLKAKKIESFSGGMEEEMKGDQSVCEDAGVRGGGGEGGESACEGVSLTRSFSVDAAIWIVEPRSLAEGMRVDKLPRRDVGVA